MSCRKQWSRYGTCGMACLVLAMLVGCATGGHDEPVRRVIMTRPYLSHHERISPPLDRTPHHESPRWADSHAGFQVSSPLARMVVTSAFGAPRGRTVRGGGGSRIHRGVDLRAAVGTPVRAPRDAVVRTVRMASGYGLMVELDHGGGWVSLFAHLSRARVRVGQHVARGDVVAMSGDSGRVTGPHLHWELRHEGRALNPLDYLFHRP